MSYNLSDFHCLTISSIFSVLPSQCFSLSHHLSDFHCLTISVIFNVSPWWFVRLFVGLCVSSLIGSSICHILFWFKVFHCVNHIWTMGAFLARDNRVFKRLRSFACTAHSAHSLYSAPLCHARFTCLLCSWARSLTLLTPSWDSWNL